MFASDLHKHNKLSICLLNIIWGGICNVNKTTRWSKKFRDISQPALREGGGGRASISSTYFSVRTGFFKY